MSKPSNGGGQRSTSSAAGILRLTPVYQEMHLPAGETSDVYSRHILLLCGLAPKVAEVFRTEWLRAELITLSSGRPERPDLDFMENAEQLLSVVQEVLADPTGGKVLIQLVVHTAEQHALQTGLYAFLQSARLENPRMVPQLIETAQGVSDSELVRVLHEAKSSLHTDRIRIRPGSCDRLGWRELDDYAGEAVIPWKDHGVYLITGGAGGLGLRFAADICHKVNGPNIILAGRTPLTPQKEEQLGVMQSLEAHVEYIQSDISQKDQVNNLVLHLIRKYGTINGIIHSAGVIQDGFILKKTGAGMHRVLSPKVSGLTHLDTATKDMPLDFLVLCSSIAGSLGNPGQADYAAANAYMDAYASYRNQLATAGRRYGRTLSVNWPLWKDGGMGADGPIGKSLEDNLGLTPMETLDGLMTLYRGITTGHDRIMVVSGDIDRWRKEWLAPAGTTKLADPSIERTEGDRVDADPDLLFEKTADQLIGLFGRTIQIPVTHISLKEPLESYGIDSLIVNQMNQQLERIFGELSKTLFYEYMTLGEIAHYLAADHKEACARWTGLSEKKSPAVSHKPEQMPEEHSVFPVLVSRKKKAQAASSRPVRVQREQPTLEPIAIIGISGRYPQAANLNEFWDNLLMGKDNITEVPEDRWPVDGFYTPDPEEAAAKGMSSSKWGGFLEGFADFDPLFFNISPREAMIMDPQERLFLQACWQALEDAGYTRELLASRHQRRVGVFAGITKTGYDLYGPPLWQKGEYTNPYTSFSSVANRVSYFLNLNGPSMPVDTMCSSSLTAIHEACEHLRRNDCEVAIAGGVNLYLHPSSYHWLTQHNMLSRDGKCRSFGEGASGFVPGEGVGVVILKPLSSAIRDQDVIHAVVRSTATNHGGKTNGYTVPSPAAQGELIRSALDKAGIDARTITYVEAHGTGTELGDPIEIKGLTQAFAEDTSDTGFCAIGSAKSNIGHLEAAAGIAGLTKIVLQMKHHTLVPSLHASRLNPNITFRTTPFAVQQHAAEWERPVIDKDGKHFICPRRAGVSSFGAGGSNAHAILEEYWPEEAPGSRHTPLDRGPVIIALSAKTEAALKGRAAQLLEVITDNSWAEDRLADMAYTLQVGREAMEERMAILTTSREDLRTKLESFVNDRTLGVRDGLYRGRAQTADSPSNRSETDGNVASYLKDEQYGPIAECWVQGYAFDWNRLYPDTLPRRISLPAYPFARERYFIGDRVRESGPLNISSAAESRHGAAADVQTTGRISDVIADSEASAPLPPGKGRRQEMIGLGVIQCLELDVKKQIGELLHLSMNRLNNTANLADFGCDSISLSQLASRLSRLLDIDLSPSVFFGHSTIDKLVHYIHHEFADVVADFYREPLAAAAQAGPPVQPGQNVPPGQTVPSGTPSPTDHPAPRRMSGVSDRILTGGDHPEPIAIIGMSGRFPGARDIGEMWSVLTEGRSEVTEIPADRFDWRSYYSDSGRTPGKTDSKWLGSLPGVKEFDPLFFDIAPKDAELMDPRQRLLLQEAWKALEHAGFGDPQVKQGRIGMFVGAEQGDYQQLVRERGITSNHNAILAARLSYFLNLYGPVLTVDTACSSGLAAAHQACLSLRSGECETAIAAGVNLMLTPEPYEAMSQAGMLSPDGTCFTFDQRANGLVPGEAIAVVVLKRLSKAEQDGDQILAVIRGSGINYDGKTNGITAPSAVAQTELLRTVYGQAGVNPAEIGYVVAHGTGTKLGDPVEVHALQEAFRHNTDKREFCAITSNKPNFGHTFAASGLVNMIHLVQAFQHEMIPGSVHLEQANDFIQWNDSPLYVNRNNTPWPETDKGRYGAVSAFGMSGTNVHMVLQSYPRVADEKPGETPPYFLLAVSAKTKEALESKAKDLAEMLQQESATLRDLVHISYTLLEGRQHFHHRMAVIARNPQEAVHLLSQAGSRNKQPHRLTGKVPVDFTGQTMIERYVSTLTGQAAALTGEAGPYKDALLALADLYCQGYRIDGAALLSGLSPRRTYLPSYPFQREEYWISDGQQVNPPASGQERFIMKSEAAPEENEDLMTFEEVWQREAPQMNPSRPWRPRTLLCFLNEDAAKQQVLEMVRERSPGTRILFISQHSPDSRLSEEEHTITVTDPDSYADALAGVKESDPELDAVLYLWAMEKTAFAKDYAAIVHMVQALSAARLKPKQLLLAGRYRDELERCHLESWIGFERSLGMVMPGMKVTTAIMKNVSAEADNLPESWFPKLWTELGTGQAQSVLYEGDSRQVCRVRPIALKQSSSHTGKGGGWIKQGGTYLITGGLGGLGLLFAKHLAAGQPVNLVLSGRSPLDTHQESKIAYLESLGCSVYYVQADLCDLEAMRHGLMEAKRRFGAIDGVLHAAGISDSRTILKKDAGDFLQVLAPKITGTLILDEMLQSEPPAWVCYFGSSSAVLGDFGSCDYAVGNRFEMAYARYRAHAVNGRTLVINWPLWKDGGMGFRDEDSTAMYLQSSGLRLLEAGEGLEAFERMLSSDSPQYLLLAGRPSRVHRFLGLAAPEREAVREAEIVEAPAPVSPASQAGKGWRPEMRGWSVEQSLERDLKEQIVDLLKIPIQHLDPEENWADFGFDSIHLAQFATRLSEYYGLDITPSQFFGQSTIAKLTGYIMDEHQATMEAFYQEGKRPSAPAEDTIKISAETVKSGTDSGLNHAMSGRQEEWKTEEIQNDAARPAEISNPSGWKPLITVESEPLVEPIAIIGMSGRFPESRTIDDMWEILSEGKSAVHEVPLDRFDWRLHTCEAESGGEKVFCRWSGTVPGADEFDPMFFEISPKEAELIDPRQRLLLQESWKALEDAGYGEERVKESTIGMFVGVEDGDYQLLTKEHGSITSNHNAVLAARLSYFLNLTGPNMAINTACSSGLVAVHQACMSLRNGECDTAIAAGVNLLLTPNAYDGISRAGILSEDGVCYAFDQRANGTVPGEAVAVIVLKRLSKAVQDRDPIYAVIRGSGVNYDGKTNGITAPSGTAQAGLIRHIYRQYQIDPEQIGYIVTHGTGTKLGDPVEINALNEAFRTFTPKQRYCAVTSTKTNFGHTFAASGLVSLISLVMSLRHGIIPASLNCEQENEYIRWDDSPFYVNKAKREWDPSVGGTRMGAVSAFGMSGTNAHMVVESYLGTQGRQASELPPYYLLTLSAKTREALEEKATDLVACLRCRKWTDEGLRKMSYTLLQGRHHFQYRCAVVIQDREDAESVLQQAFQGVNTPNFFEGRVPRHFTGQRAIQQYIQDMMNRSLDQFQQPPVYRDTMLALADLYCQGYSIDGKQLFGGNLPGMIHLPAYPFTREHYWVKTAGDGETAAGNPNPGQSNQERTQEAGSPPGLLQGGDMNRVQKKAFEPELSAALDNRPAGDHESVIPISAIDEGKARAAATAEHLRILVAEATGIPHERLEDEASFEEIGLDSLTIHGLNAKVEQWIGTLDSTLFYKYNNIKQLGDYLAQEYGDAVFGRFHKISTAKSASVPDDRTLDDDPAQRERPEISWKPVIPSAAASSRSERKSAEPAARNEEATGPSAGKEGSADIAIIGLAGRFPKAGTLEQFWTNLYEGRDCIEEIPASRWPLNGFYEPDRVKAVAQGLSYSKWGGFLDRIEFFDPLFFNIAPRDAMYMDPQERLFLEAAWECVEDAGYTRDSLKQDGYGNQIGVFVGATFNNYQLFMADAANRANQGQYLATSQMFSIANRVSYVMNFTGPSLTVDTACSSSLYAVHLACESIRNGQSRMAIAGGVNLTLHPSKYITLSQGQFNASDGRCRAFAEGGTGYVPAEAVGAVLLKPLDEAIRDRDSIYGVIKGTAVSHAGKTNGYTVPSPVSQSQAIEKALMQSGIHPRTISCIEAHGTGTALGDPIEIKGLTDVYSRYTEDTGYCSISSVKSNIGHAEAAAGIAQLTKVLLQLKHRTLVRNVMHGSGLNPNIDFGRTPFVVQAETADWKRPVIDGHEMPRRAGISSFGAGGANAHVIVEEYTTALEENGTGSGTGHPAVILLSAKNEDQLTAQASRLLSAVRQRGWSDEVLPHLAYTLQVGREAMEERLGIAVQTLQELEAKLDAFIQGRGQGKEYVRGQVKRNKEMISVIESDEEFQETIRKWMDRGKYSKVLELWTKGLSVDWNLMYGDVKPFRMSLPTYPFAGEPYWVPEIDTPSVPSVNASLPSGLPAAVMHPLLHRNTSDMSGVRFSSTFTGREFFLADHIVRGNSVLPGVAYLEMALTAVGQAVPEAQREDGWPAVRLKNVVWARPITVMDTDTPVNVHIDLVREDHGEFAFEVYTVQERAEAEAEMILHSQGTAAVEIRLDRPVVDLQKFRTQCHPAPIKAADIYALYNEMGIQYGPGHQGIHEVWTGDGIVAADIRLPVQLTGTEADFLLHPSLLDSALQATVAMMMEPGQGAMDGMKAGLPFALQELEVYGRCPASAWAVIRYSDDHKHNSPVQRVNIDVCDEAGIVYVRMNGFSTRTAEAASPSNGMEENAGVLLFEPEWSECHVPMNAEVPAYTSRLVFLCELGEGNTHALVNQPDHTRCIVLNEPAGNMAERFMAYSQAVFSEIQGVLAQKPKDKVLIQVVMTTRAEHRYLAGLSGLLKAARSENSKLIGQFIELDNVDGSISGPLTESSKCPADAHIRYADGKRWTAGWREIEQAISVDALPWKDHGVYMITGGAGALGLAFVQEIISRVKEPTLILTGRSPVSLHLEAALQDLRTTGANVIYKEADAADSEQITQLVHWIGKQHGTLNGIIHAAGIIRDNLIMNKGPAELREVLLPKVAGLVHLDEASRDIPLDFLIAFSSVAGATGNPGQADYSAANAFMDAYSAYRSHLAATGERHGRMLSINWPLWKDGGMRVDAEVEKIMLQSLGTVPMETGNGIRALYQGYAAGTEQVVVMAGVRSRIRARMLRSNPLPSAKDTGTSLQTGKDLSSYVQKVLLEGVSSLLKVKVEEIDADSELSDYGFDSISLTQFANVLNERFHLELTPTLFFEYTTLSGFAEYLISENPEAFAHRSESESRTVEVSDTPVHSSRETVIPTVMEPVQTALPTAWSSRRSRPAVPAARVEEQPAVARDAYAVKQDPEPIAIVGISGVFPGARDIRQFWSNIVEGMNGITEIPPDRWDWKEYAKASAENGGASSLKWGGFIEGLKEFDPLFFGISPREAELMDPQQRLLLMQAWKAVEDAGMAASQLSQQPTGVFVAAGPGDYMSMTGIEQGNPQAMTGVVPSLIPNRISYALNLHGPSEYYETACSSMLVALHRAVRSLQSGECQQAIVGAVNLLISPAPFIGFDAMGYLSPEGSARSFQPEANGFIRSEGVGAVVLKPLSQAIADHHEIYAVIRGTGVSHGGKGMSLTSPNAHGMKTAIHQAFCQSGIDPRTISYIEGHGIASPMADGIEVNALKSGYREMAEAVSDVPWENPCYIGTLKPLIGHSEVASGLASLIKVIYALRHRLIPGISGFTAPSSHIFLDGSPLRFSSEHLSWKVLTDENGIEIPRRAAINSFGIGGVNGHILLEEYIPPKGEPERERSDDEAQLFVLSAKNKERLSVYARLLLQHVEQAEGLSLADMAYTLQVGREAMESRLALAADTREELIHGLKVFLNDVAHQRNDNPYETIPIYTGNKGSLPKENQAHHAAAWIAGANLQQLAVYWVRGGKVEWEQLHQGKGRKRIPLPTYPFEPRICWPASLQTESKEAQFAQISSLTQEATAAAVAAISEGKQVLELVSSILGLEPDEIHPDVPLDQYGLDSILLMQLLRQLQNDIDPGIDLYRLQECRSLKDIIQILPVSKPDALRNKPLRAAPTPAALPRSWPQFPELILLNNGLQGPPVFWFHGGLGGVEMYQELAFQSKRPFYGIQARGWMTEREPLQGIAAMAAYYSHLIQTVQPDGPYDLGGYSLGGVLAYEVTRQLQELGKTVKTLVMLDSPYGEAFQQGEISRSTAVLQAVNLALASKNFQRPDAFADTLIHRDELDGTVDEERLLQQLIQLGYARGLTKTEKQIRAMIDANIKMQHAYQFDRFRVMPLPDASGVTCYYFRNKRGLIFGELEPYFSIGEDTAPLNQAAYWEEWERQFPQLHMIDIDPSNHMVLLSEPRSYETIFEFCSRLYSEEGMLDSELEDFKKNAMNAFGGK